MTRSFLLIHGWGGNSKDHWMNHLAEKLRTGGFEVAYPKLPHPDSPRKDEWVKALVEAYKGLSEDVVVVGHSLGPVAWMHVENKHEISAKKVIMVAPVPLNPDIKQIETFFPYPKGFKRTETAYLIIASDNDPYIDYSHIEKFAKEHDLPLKLMKGQGHINTASGYGQWDDIYNICTT